MRTPHIIMNVAYRGIQRPILDMTCCDGNGSLIAAEDDGYE
jgi:hypothetical protein